MVYKSLLKILFLWTVVNTSLCCKSDTVSNTDMTYSVVLIVGQSNTHSGIGLNTELDTAEEGIVQLGRFGTDDMQIISAVEPLQHHTKDDNKIGFGLTYAKLLKEHLNSSRQILLVPCGFGGTGFRDSHWNQGDYLYSDAVNRVRSIINSNPGSELTSILWHQGESDIGSPSYEADLDNFIINLRSDLNVPNVPFILGGMVPYWVDQAIERVQQQTLIMNVVNRHPFVGYANPELPFRIQKEDNLVDEIHYDAAGQRELGRRYFSEYLLLTD